MRIVHAIRSDGFAGVERHVATLAAAQARSGHRVVVIGGDPVSMNEAAPGTRCVPAASTGDVARALRRYSPGADVVHVHMTAAEIAASIVHYAPWPRRPPVVATRHFASPRGQGRAGRLAAHVARRAVDRQIAISDYVRERIDGTAVVIAPAVATQPDAVPATERDRVILMAQRLESEKATDVGLRAFAASGLAEDGWRLDIAGDGHERDVLAALAAELGIAGSVRFLGACSDVLQRMRTATVLLAPCPVEGLGLSVLEAMAAGLPVLASDAGGHRETLALVDPALLHEPGSADDLAARLRALAPDAARRAQIAADGQRIQRERFTPARQCTQINQVYLSARQAKTSNQSGEPAMAGGNEGRRTDVVVVSLEAWDQVWRRNQYLVHELLKADPGLRVLFVEPAADPLYAASRRRPPRLGRGLRPGPDLPGVGENRLWLYEPTKSLPRRLDPRVDERLAKAMRYAMLRTGMERPVLWLNDPSAAILVESTGWPALYDITDDWVQADRVPTEHRRLLDDEATLMAQCAEVVVCSPHLQATKSVVRPVTLISNGVDLDRYQTPVPRPVDLPGGPVALYVGTVHPDRFDLPTLLATAERIRGEGTVVLVGPVVDLTRAEETALQDAGVVTLGPRDFTAIPGYLQHADVLLVPHLVNDFTDSLDPIKLYEYRAVGRPVVSTPVAGFRDSTDPAIHVVDAQEFPQEVARLLNPDPASTQPVRDGEPGTWVGAHGSGQGSATLGQDGGPEHVVLRGEAAKAHGVERDGDDEIPTWSRQARLMAKVIARTAARQTDAN